MESEWQALITMIVFGCIFLGLMAGMFVYKRRLLQDQNRAEEKYLVSKRPIISAPIPLTN